jgi:hypothetical protein
LVLLITRRFIVEIVHTIVLESLAIIIITSNTDRKCQFIVIENPTKQLGERSSGACRANNSIEHRDLEQDKIDSSS